MDYIGNMFQAPWQMERTLYCSIDVDLWHKISDTLSVACELRNFLINRSEPKNV